MDQMVGWEYSKTSLLVVLTLAIFLSVDVSRLVLIGFLYLFPQATDQMVGWEYLGYAAV